jgi:hypothetical protein
MGEKKTKGKRAKYFYVQETINIVIEYIFLKCYKHVLMNIKVAHVPWYLREKNMAHIL